VKQSDLGEYEEKCKRKTKYTIYKINHNSPSNQVVKMANINFSPQISKAKSIERFGEDIGQLSIAVYISHLNVSLLYMVSQEVVSPLMVSYSLVEDKIFGYEDGTGVITHERNSLKAHSKVSHGVHNP
jgi:hypothetical protein